MLIMITQLGKMTRHPIILMQELLHQQATISKHLVQGTTILCSQQLQAELIRLILQTIIIKAPVGVYCIRARIGLRLAALVFSFGPRAILLRSRIPAAAPAFVFPLLKGVWGVIPNIFRVFNGKELELVFEWQQWSFQLEREQYFFEHEFQQRLPQY